MELSLTIINAIEAMWWISGCIRNSSYAFFPTNNMAAKLISVRRLDLLPLVPLYTHHHSISFRLFMPISGRLAGSTPMALLSVAWRSPPSGTRACFHAPLLNPKLGMQWSPYTVSTLGYWVSHLLVLNFVPSWPQ
jgi:hypothetical protein